MSLPTKKQRAAVPSFNEIMGDNSSPVPSFDDVMSEKKNLVVNDATKELGTESNGSFSAIDPTQQFETINTPNGVSFSIDKTKIPAPLNTPEFVSQTQQRINDGIILPQDEEAIALGTGKKIKAVSAYLQGDNKTGYSVDRMDLVEKNRNNLTKIIEDYNTKNNESIIPEALLADPDKLSAWAQMYKAKIEKEIRNNTISDAYAPAGSGVGKYINEANAKKAQFIGMLDNFSIQKPDIDNHIVEITVEQDLKNGVAPDITLQKIANRLDPRGYANAQKALGVATGVNSINKNSTGGDFLGALYDEIVGTGDKEEVLNSVIGIADIQRNNAIQKLATDKAAEGYLSGNTELLTEAKNLSEQYDENVINKYPALRMQQMAAEISGDIARESGNVEGSTMDGLANLKNKVIGADYTDYIQRMTDKGWFDNPETRDLANRLASSPELFSDASYLGGATSSFIQPFKDLGLSVFDISGVRNKKDIISDKVKDEMFPIETPGLTGITKGIRTVVNTTSNLAGMIAIGSATANVGRLAGIGLTEVEIAQLSSQGQKAETIFELSAKAKSANNSIELLSNAMSFGLPSVDANLKDSYNFIDNDAARATFAGMGAILNTAGGKLLDLPKISAVPGLANNFAEAAQRLTAKDIEQKAAAELLNEGKNKYVEFAVKYGKNVTEGAATMAYFTATNQILKSAFGDPNTNAEDVIKNTGHAFLDGVLGMMVFGAVKTVKDFNVNKNSSFKSTLYNMSVTPDATADIFKLGKKSDADFNQKMQILNTTVVAKRSLDAAMTERDIVLDPNQQAVFVANKTVEAYLRKQAETATDAQKTELIVKADKLKEQSTQTLEGLTFTETLEPLYDIFYAEKEYNNAVDEINNGAGSLEKIEAAKLKIDEAVERHQSTKSNPVNKVDSNGDIIPVVETISLKDGEVQQGFNRAIPQLSEEQVQLVEPTILKVNKSEGVNEKELNDAQDVLYEALDSNPGASHLIEPLILKLQDYGNTTKTENRTVTEEVAVENARPVVERKPLSKSLSQWEGSRATTVDATGKEVTGVLRSEDGKYSLYNENGDKVASIGEKAITDRDVTLPSKEDVPIPIEFDKDGNVKSITLQLNKVDKENGGVQKDRVIKVEFSDKEKALDYAIQLRAEEVGTVPQPKFDTVYEQVSKEVNVEVPVAEANKNAALKLVEPIVGKGALMGMNAEQSLRYIAEQAQNIGEGGLEVSPIRVDARGNAERIFGSKEVVDAAIAIYPRESLLSKELPTPKVEDVVLKSEIEFREPDAVSKILTQNLTDRNKLVEHTNIIDGTKSLSKAKDVQRQERKTHKLLDLLIDCLTK